jgi:KDO2-lipid IV(A) lauroyltransferase
MGRSITASHRVEYGALRTLVAALDRVGLHGAARFAEWLGPFGYAPLGIRRAVVEQQIAASFPEFNTARVGAVARASYANLARTTIETTLLPGYTRAEILGLVEATEGWEVVEERLALGKGLILISGHIGNWELGGAFLAAKGLPLDVVARHMGNPLVDRFLTQTREQIGMHVVHDEDAVRRVPRALRQGGVVAFLVDQATIGLASTWVSFFGRQAKTPRGPAVFALRLGSPVIFVAVIRQPNGRYRIAFEPVEVTRTGDLETDVDRIVQAYTTALERWVRRAPEQYFWQHRRWKHQLPGAPTPADVPA